MTWLKSLQVGLKEWATVCQALSSGRQMILLRKGGVSDAGGTFEVKHPRFVLFPTYLHQNLNMLKLEAHAGFEAWASEPASVDLQVGGEVTDILRLRSREQMNALDAEHIWTSAMVDYRFNYKPENPLYLLLVRAYRLESPVTIKNAPAYAGCKSWVPLDQPVETEKARSVLNDVEYENRRRSILGKLELAYEVPPPG